jgi:hypothetical protein
VTSPRFAYAQARLGARHAERVSPATWLRLETHRSAESFLEAARATPLARWLGRVDRNPDPHAVEAALELEFANHVEEVADWIDDPWARSVRWLRWLPLLERDDRHLDWYEHFRSLWPRTGRQGLEALCGLVTRHLAAMATAASAEDGPMLRAELARDLAREFRRQPASPVALVSHLGLTLLDLERLRGGILVRLLFSDSRRAAWA